MKLPEKVKQIIAIFEKNGYEAYAVGGCVRDSLLEKEPEDWDVTTNASPAEIKSLFRRTVDTGIAHGTVTVLLGNDSFEVTTYRIDGSYEDSRHPKEVTFTTDLKEDLRRRDFTINAMAYNDKSGMVDCFGGMEDLQKGVIRCVGNAEARFSEDALRILRCLRFSAQLGFRIEEETKEAVIRLAPNLKKISAERIAAEWSKLLCAPHTDRVMTAYRYGVLQQFFPELLVTDRLVRAVTLIPWDGCGLPAGASVRQLKYAMLFCELDDGLAGTLLRRLKFDNDTIRMVTGMVRYKNWKVAPDGPSVRKAVYEAGERLFPLLPAVWSAYREAGYEDGPEPENISEVARLYGEIIERGDCLSLKTLAVKGRDLIQLGVAPGKELGGLLEKLLFLVLEDPARNTKDFLLKMI